MIVLIIALNFQFFVNVYTFIYINTRVNRTMYVCIQITRNETTENRYYQNTFYIYIFVYFSIRRLFIYLHR